LDKPNVPNENENALAAVGGVKGVLVAVEDVAAVVEDNDEASKTKGGPNENKGVAFGFASSSSHRFANTSGEVPPALVVEPEGGVSVVFDEPEEDSSWLRSSSSLFLSKISSSLVSSSCCESMLRATMSVRRKISPAGRRRIFSRALSFARALGTEQKRLIAR